MYFINDFANRIGQDPLSWEESEAFVRIYGPNGAGVTNVELNQNRNEMFFVVGCFTNTGFNDFMNVEAYTDAISNICPS